MNDNEEVKQYEGKTVKVVGSPAPFGWSVTFTTPDNRTLKTSSVFGVDTSKSFSRRAARRSSRARASRARA